MTTRGKNRMLTTSEAAEMLYLHVNTLRRWNEKGVIKSYRIGPRGDRRFLLEDIVQYQSSQQYFKDES